MSPFRGIEAKIRAWPLLAMLAVLAYVGGGFSGWPLVQHVAYVLIGLDLLAFLLVRMGQHGLVASYALSPESVTAGTPFEESYRFEKQSRLPALWIEIEDDDSVGTTSFSLRGGQTRTVTRSHTIPRRGLYHLRGSSVRVREPLGLVALTGAVSDGVEISVFPRPIETIAALEAIRSIHAGQRRWFFPSVDATVGEIRPYAEGDPPSRIHWRSTARRGSLMVADPDTEKPAAIWLLVDLGGDEEVAERAAGIAAFLVNQLTRLRQPVGAVVAGEALEIVAPARDPSVAPDILHAMARTSTHQEQQLPSLIHAAQRYCTEASVCLLISSSPDAASLAKHLRPTRLRVNVIPALAAGGHGS